MAPEAAGATPSQDTLYIYYRTGVDGDGSATAAIILSVLERVSNELSVSAQLFARRDEGKGYRTWMEVFGNVGPVGEVQLAEALRRASLEYGLTPLMLTARTVERFSRVTAESGA